MDRPLAINADGCSWSYCRDYAVAVRTSIWAWLVMSTSHAPLQYIVSAYRQPAIDPPDEPVFRKPKIFCQRLCRSWRSSSIRCEMRACTTSPPGFLNVLGSPLVVGTSVCSL